jgi:hypothetical protein
MNHIHAQGIFESASQNHENSEINLNGYTRGEAWGGNNTYDYANLFGEFALQGKLQTEKALLKADVRFREGMFLGKNETVFELKEAYAAYQSNYADLYLGKQITTWGRTDGFNPTNNLCPQNYFLLTTNPDDQLRGNFMLRTKFRPTQYAELELVIIPVFTPSVYRYDLFDLSEETSFTNAVLPKKTFENGTWAARANIELSKIGFSLSYFNGYDPFYGYRVESVHMQGQPSIVLQPDFYRKQSIGADFAATLGNYIIRGETAYNITDGYKTEMHIPNPDIAWVAGIEKNIAQITVIMQYIGKYTFNFEALTEPTLTNPANITEYALAMINFENTLFNRKIMHQQEEMNHAVMLSLSKSFSFDIVTTSISAYYNITSEEYFVRPEINWKMADALTLSAVANIMNGPEKSIFNKAGKVLGGYGIGLKFNF